MGVAIVGSAARQAGDEWSDIDLVLQLAPDADEQAVVDNWTQTIRNEYGVADTLIGRGWLYALHARSSTARGRLWQAAMMLDDLRAQLIALKCLRHNLNPWHGRQVDQLPADELAELVESRATIIDVESLDALASGVSRAPCRLFSRHVQF